MEALLNKPSEISYGETGSSTVFENLSNYWSISDVSTVFPSRQAFTQEISQLLQRLDRIEQLEDNWDQYGATSPSQIAVQAARDFVLDNRDLALPFYFIAPGVSGEIMLEFSQDNRAAEVYFYQNRSTELILFEDDETVFEGSLQDHFSQLIHFFNE
jgi:hypothetical protein